MGKNVKSVAATTEGTVRVAEPGEFPKMLYKNGDVTVQKIVNSIEEEDALGEDWWDRPAGADGADGE